MADYSVGIAMLVAFLAMVLAYLMALLGPRGVLETASADDLGEFLFAAHGLDMFRFAMPLAFSRYAVPASNSESFRTRLLLAVFMGAAALSNLHLRRKGFMRSFAMLLGIQSASYFGLLSVWGSRWQACLAACAGGCVSVLIVDGDHWLVAARIALSLGTGIGVQRLMAQFEVKQLWMTLAVMLSGSAFGWFVILRLVAATMTFFLPVEEIMHSYRSVSEFVGAERLNGASMEMLLITINVQVSLGYLGIANLRYAQERRNLLLTVGAHKDALSASGYMRHVRHWVFVLVLPYVLQQTVMTSQLSHAFGRFRHWTERSLRLHAVFPGDGKTGNLLKAVAVSNYTVEAYADAINGVVEQTFGIVSAKLSVLPKLLLVPGVLSRKPWLFVAVFPVSVALDIGKARVAATLTVRIEALHRELMELASRRRRMELHDMKHEELIQRGRATPFAQRRWRELGDQIEDRGMRISSMQRLRGFVDSIYNNQLLGPGIECALAFLMEVGYVTTSDIGLYSTVIEQAIDTLLMRHRLQATLANMQTKIGLVDDLAQHLARMRARARPTCAVEPGTDAATVTSLEYARGQTYVRIPKLQLPTGQIFAVTGANGCGKSTALALIACCGRSAAALPTGAELLDAKASIALPSDDVVEIAQQFYCPLFASPMSWLLQQGEDMSAQTEEELHSRERRAAGLLKEFGLLDAEVPVGSQQRKRGLSTAELHAEKEDWYSELSGGERCKVEFIRKVFMRPRCPDVLLIDEAFAPLDPISKAAVQAKLKAFCAESLVLVVYHGGESQGCLKGEDFFDNNLHFANGSASLLGVC